MRLLHEKKKIFFRNPVIDLGENVAEYSLKNY